MSSVHIKLEHPEVISLKKDILTFEKGLLETLIHARDYNLLRKREFALKNEIKKKFNEAIILIAELEQGMPKEEVKEAIEGKTPRESVKEAMREHKKKHETQDKKKKDIERQIQEIKAKLAMLK